MERAAFGGDASGFVTTRLNDLLAWARKYSLFALPYVTACCGMEFMALWAPRYDISRFGAEAPRFSPRQRARAARGAAARGSAPGAAPHARLRGEPGDREAPAGALGRRVTGLALRPGWL